MEKNGSGERPKFYYVDPPLRSSVDTQGLGPSARDKVFSTVVADKIYPFKLSSMEFKKKRKEKNQ